MYGIVELLYCTPETSITYVLTVQQLKEIKKIYLVLLCRFYFFCWCFLFFTHFKWADNCLLKSGLKSSSDNSNISVMLVLGVFVTAGFPRKSSLMAPWPGRLGVTHYHCLCGHFWPHRAVGWSHYRWIVVKVLTPPRILLIPHSHRGIMVASYCQWRVKYWPVHVTPLHQSRARPLL